MRGTPQQIIDKYNQLARDAQLAGDRVAAENFQQHAEHYLRLLGVAQKEQDARREEQDRQNRERQAERDRERAKRQERESNGGDPVDMPQPDILESGAAAGDSNLVETPEDHQPAEKPKRARKPRKPKESADEKGPGPSDGNGPNSQEAAE